MIIPYACPECGAYDVLGISGHATGRCKPVTKPVTMVVTTKLVTCNQCVTKDAEIERLRNQIADAQKMAHEWSKVAVEVGRNERKKAKRDRAAYMRDYRSEKN